MFPNISIFGINIGWFNLNLIIATIICAIFVYHYVRNKTTTPFPIKLLVPFAALSAFLGLLGARLLSVVEIYAANDGGELPYSLLEYLLYHGGYSFYGGMLLNLLVLIAIHPYLKSIKFPALDILAMNCCLAYALGRIGCQISGDGCYGIATTLPWGMYYPYGPAPNILPVHPTPIYEVILNLGLFFYLLRLDKKKKFQGQTAAVFLICFSVFRFLIEIIRVNDAILIGMSMAQIIAIVLFAIGIVFYLINARQVASGAGALKVVGKTTALEGG